MAEVQATYIVVEKGFFFPTDYYIPVSAITQVGDRQVALNVSKDTALHSGWETMPETTGGMTTGERAFDLVSGHTVDRLLAEDSATAPPGNLSRPATKPPTRTSWSSRCGKRS